MSVIVDLILILIIAISVFEGYKRGLIGSIAGTLSIIVAVSGAFLFLTPTAKFIDEKYVNSYVSEKTASTINVDFEQINQNELLEKVESQKDKILDVAEKFGIKRSDAESVIKKAKEKTDKTEIMTTMTAPMADKISRLLAFAVLFVGLSIVLKIIIIIVNSILKLPILKETNRLLGLALGGIKGILIVGIISLIILNLIPRIQSIPGVNIQFGDIINSKIVQLFKGIKVSQLFNL